MSTATTLPPHAPPSSPTTPTLPPPTSTTTTTTITLLPLRERGIVRTFIEPNIDPTNTTTTPRRLIVNGPLPDPKDPTFLRFNTIRAQHNAAIQNQQALNALRIIAPSSSSKQHNIHKTLRKARRLLRKLRAAQLTEEAA
jgi:hypothetical protein